MALQEICSTSCILKLLVIHLQKQNILLLIARLQKYLNLSMLQVAKPAHWPILYPSTYSKQVCTKFIYQSICTVVAVICYLFQKLPFDTLLATTR